MKNLLVIIQIIFKGHAFRYDAGCLLHFAPSLNSYGARTSDARKEGKLRERVPDKSRMRRSIHRMEIDIDIDTLVLSRDMHDVTNNDGIRHRGTMARDEKVIGATETTAERRGEKERRGSNRPSDLERRCCTRGD